MFPIIFIHSRNNDYLPLSLWKARETNPNREIILLGDGQNAHFSFLVRHENISKYRKRADAFREKFVNFSTNPSDFERICLERWLILEEFLLSQGLEKCLYLDSDVLLYDDIEIDARRFSAFGMTVAGISGHTNFISRVSALSDFCLWIEAAYQSPESLRILEEKYALFRQTHDAGGISDMTFFTEFREARPDALLDIGQPADGKLYDITITYTKGLIAEGGIKKITWKQEAPFVESTEKESIEMRSLHFQGESKKWMKQMARIDSQTFEWIYNLNKVFITFQKAWNKIGRMASQKGKS